MHIKTYRNAVAIAHFFPDDMVFLPVHGKVGKLELGEVSFKSAPGAGAMTFCRLVVFTF